MYDVFISYSSENEAEARQIYDILEKNGLSVWFAPEYMKGHRNFTKVIPSAIRNSKVYLLLMSSYAQKSKWVARELVYADDYDLPIYTLFIENCKLQEDFKFILSTNQYYGYTEDKTHNINRMISEIKGYIDHGDDDGDGVPDKEVPEYVIPWTEKKPKKPFFIAAAIILALALIITGITVFGGKKTKGYVIWAPSYSVAMTGDTVHSHYLAGEKIGVEDSLPVSYSESCVWQVKFNDDGTVTISRDGVTLGVQPGYNGIGLGGSYTADLWEITESDNGTCYIQNVTEGSYLEWYADKENWATHNKMTSENRSMFILRMDPVK